MVLFKNYSLTISLGKNNFLLKTKKTSTSSKSCDHKEPKFDGFESIDNSS